MTIKIQGDKITFPDDSEQTTAYNGSSGGGIPEAPIDGKQYGRQDAEWTEVTGGGSTTPLLYEEVYPDNLDDVVSTGYTPLTGTLTADVVAGKKYQITGGCNGVAKNKDGVNTFSYWKLATVLNGGTAEDTLCNMVIGSQSSAGGVGTNSPMERTFTYTAPESGTLELTAYCRVAGAGANGAFQNNVIRIEEVAEETGSGGETTDILPVLYSGMVKSDGTIISGTGFTATKLSGDAGQYEITFDTPREDYLYSVNAIVNTGSSRLAVLRARSETGFQINIIETNGTAVGAPVDGNFQFSVIGQETIAVGGGSGGGSYTPEKMVWEDKLAERAWATEYVNPYDVPLYLQIGASSTDAEACTWGVTINGISMGGSGKHSGSSAVFNTSLFVVPAGGTYSANKTRTNTLQAWNEAKMPVAVGTGGGTPSSFARIVDEKPEGIAGGSAVIGIQQRTLNKIVYDADNIVTLSEDKSFTLQAGTYVINYSAPVFQVNDSKVYLHSVTDNVMADNGECGYNEGGYASGRYNGTYAVTLTEPHTYQVQQYASTAKEGNGLGTASVIGFGVGIFATVDIEKVGTGGSGSGDSIWTEEDGRAVYDGDIKVNGVSVEKDSLLSFYPADKSYANIKFEWDTGDAGYLHTTAFNGMKWTVNGNEAMSINSDGNATLENGFVKIKRDGQEINLNPNYNGDGAVVESNESVSLVSNSKYGVTVNTDGSVKVGLDNNGNASLSGGAGGGANSFRDTENNVGLHHFYGGNNGSQVLKAVVYCDDGRYEQSSDYRLKKDVKGIESALDKVNQLKPINYTIKSSERETSGFLAHELQKVLPNSVTGTKDKETKDGKPDYQMIDYSSIIPVLTKAIQELSARVDELEKKVK